MLSRLTASSESGFVSGNSETSRQLLIRSSSALRRVLEAPACASRTWRMWSARGIPRASACALRLSSISGGRSIVTDMMRLPRPLRVAVIWGRRALSLRRFHVVFVTPAKAGVQVNRFCDGPLDSRLRGNHGCPRSEVIERLQVEIGDPDLAGHQFVQ